MSWLARKDGQGLTYLCRLAARPGSVSLCDRCVFGVVREGSHRDLSGGSWEAGGVLNTHSGSVAEECLPQKTVLGKPVRGLSLFSF